MITLERLAGMYNIDIEILKGIYQNGYSQGWDDAMTYNKDTEEEFSNLELFNVERHKGQKE